MALEKSPKTLRPKHVEIIPAPAPLRAVTLESDGEAITAVHFGRRGKRTSANPVVLTRAAQEMKAFLAGKRDRFTMPLKLKGTAFQRRVWNELLRIPYGTSLTYSEIAKRLGNPKASRAVGGAVGKNPIPIVVPCHRILGRAGLGGFSGGLPIKRWLLDKEGIAY